MAFDDALRLAQEKGYAEKDPTADVDGLDTARKICILASIASGKSIRLRDCRAIEGIRGILPAHVEAALLHGFSIKLLGVYENGTVCTAPYLVPLDSLLSATNDVFNAVSITGTAVGEVVLYGRGAGARPTASAIVSDVIEAINGTCPPVFRAEGVGEHTGAPLHLRGRLPRRAAPKCRPHDRRRVRLHRRRGRRHGCLPHDAGLLRIPRARPVGLRIIIKFLQDVPPFSRRDILGESGRIRIRRTFFKILR